ncbi:MAG: hypothetical protein ACREID_07005, partial [Planctomycetota bacterium]
MTAILLGLLLGADGFSLLGVREETRADPYASPPRLVVSVDVLTPEGDCRATRRVAIRDPAMRRALFSDPFVYPERGDVAYLIATEATGLRCVRVSWSRGEDTAASFLLRCEGVAEFLSRPVRIVPERFALLAPDRVHFLDLRGPRATATRLEAPPLDLDPDLGRLYVALPEGESARVAFHSVQAADPPEAFSEKPKRHLLLPDALHP